MNQAVVKDVFQPATCEKKFTTKGQAWVYRYTHRLHGWQLSIATYGQPQSNSLSLGGFRIAPASRTDKPGYDNDAEAIGLATGMEGKVYWSRLLEVGGPLGLGNVHRIVGGKCVLLPSPNARIGQPQDFALLDFASECLHDFEKSTSIHITTGQDLGHGTMSDGQTHSLDYLNSKFAGSVRANTAMPTGEGNYTLLKGMLKGLGIDLSNARVGLIGCGNVGGHVLRRLHGNGASVFAMEAFAPKREAIATELNIPMWSPPQIAEFLRQPMDALVVNANGGSLNGANIFEICKNDRLKIICGCENLALTNREDGERFKMAGKLFAPTQLGGMFGYLTAVEEYLCVQNNVIFDVAPLMTAASAMTAVGQKGVDYVLAQKGALSFEQALQKLYSQKA